MANSEHWDTGTSTPTDGNKGATRIWNKISGTWERQWEPHVNVSGSWKRVNKIWTKTGDEWKPVFWAPEVGEELDYGTITVDPHHWYRADCKVKYLGGNPLDAASWSVMSYDTRYQNNSTSAGNTSGVSGGTTWVTGTAGNKSIYSYSGSTGGSDAGTINLNIRVGGMDYDVADGSAYTRNQSGTQAAVTVTGAPAGAFCPVVHLNSVGGAYWGTGSQAAWSRKSYDNDDELQHGPVYATSTPWNYSLT